MTSHRLAGRARAVFMSSAAITSAVIALPTHAGIVPGFEITLDLDDAGPVAIAASSTDIGGGLWNFAGNWSSATSEVSFDINVSDDPGRPDTGAFLGSNFTIQNQSLETQTYRLLVTLDLAGPAAQGNYAGSAGFGLTGTDGLLSTLPGSPLWEAFVDGASVDALFPAPTSLSFAGDGSASTSDDLSPGPLALAANDIAIAVQFSLSPGDTMIVTGAFGVIPTPTGLLVLCGPALAGGRRRRRD